MVEGSEKSEGGKPGGEREGGEGGGAGGGGGGGGAGGGGAGGVVESIWIVTIFTDEKEFSSKV